MTTRERRRPPTRARSSRPRRWALLAIAALAATMATAVRGAATDSSGVVRDGLDRPRARFHRANEAELGGWKKGWKKAKKATKKATKTVTKTAVDTTKTVVDTA